MLLEVEVLLLNCVFETFRKKSIDSFDIDPVHYLFIPCSSWNAMLKFTDVNLKLISDIEKYRINESKARGGISMICNGYAEAMTFIIHHIFRR